MWFLPALFLAYLLFWILLKSPRKRRKILLISYMAVTVACYFLPFLMPWSLDTVFMFAILIYMGYCIQSFSERIRAFSLWPLSEKKNWIVMFGIIIVYLPFVYIGKGINTSVRMYGGYGITGILSCIVVGILGALLYLLFFSALEKWKPAQRLLYGFSYIGRNSITFLGTHVAVYHLLDTICFPSFFQNGSYWVSLLQIGAALGVGTGLSIFFKWLGNKWTLFQYL